AGGRAALRAVRQVPVLPLLRHPGLPPPSPFRLKEGPRRQVLFRSGSSILVRSHFQDLSMSHPCLCAAARGPVLAPARRPSPAAATSPVPRSRASGAPRYHDLDALRAILMTLGVVIHSADIYTASPRWVINDPHGSPFFDGLISALCGFRMQAFFIIAGFFS